MDFDSELLADIGPDFASVCRVKSLHVALLPNLYCQLTEQEAKSYANVRIQHLRERLAWLQEKQVFIEEHLQLLQGLLSEIN